eukprot:CAMPEP_0198120864 /NCGR_PEP_ID=MMETSP1442-20131203/30564_1 /TAXON_ID= /ORGANISM="Craspedostauros australis, Strain CCMP3328" /LENGTH=183 /DNA_ID=CAMNT_0043779595 /DNA_START=142 /DNA_END=693 /DNA_ORIENTATION=+
MTATTMPEMTCSISTQTGHKTQPMSPLSVSDLPILQLSKPNYTVDFRKRMTATTLPRNDKLRILNEVGEPSEANITTMTVSTFDNEPSTPCLEAENSEELHESKPLIFRDAPRLALPALDEEDEDIFVLKRANPVYDSEDEEYFMSSPAKRRRTNESESTIALGWSDRVSVNDDGNFRIQFQL